MVLFSSLAADAQPSLVAPSNADIEAMGQLLERGQVALIESNARGWLKQVTVVSRIRAPVATVFRVVSEVQHYPEFLHNFSRIDVRSRQGQSVGYDWDWRGVVFDFHGSNTMSLMPPRRIDVLTTQGDLGNARFIMDFRPAPNDETILAITLFCDPRSANWAARQLVRANPSMLHAMNLSVGIVFVMGIRGRAESPGGRGVVGAPGRGGGDLTGFADVDTARLAPLLRRGELALVETNAHRGLRQATVFGQVAAEPDRVRAVVQDPARYPSFISNVESVDVVSRTGGITTYDIELDFPIFDVESRLEMSADPQGRVLVEGRQGDMRGGRWRWELLAAPGGGAVATYGGYNDMRRTGWLMRRLVALEPYFDHALNVSSKLVMVRAVKRRAEAAVREGGR